MTNAMVMTGRFPLKLTGFGRPTIYSNPRLSLSGVRLGVSTGDIQAFLNAAKSALDLYEVKEGVPPAKIALFRDQFTKCELMTTSSDELQIALGVACFVQLEKDIRKAINEPTPAAPPTTPPPSAAFPLVPVLAVGAGVIAVVAGLKLAHVF